MSSVRFCILTVIQRNDTINQYINIKYIILFRCSEDGMYQSNAYFGDCVSGDTVTDFGVGYDFKSVMHYGLKRLDLKIKVPDVCLLCLLEKNLPLSEGASILTN